MKRSREVTIIVDALTAEGLLNADKTDRARHIIKEAIKEIRVQRFKEKGEKR